MALITKQIELQEKLAALRPSVKVLNGRVISAITNEAAINYKDLAKQLHETEERIIEIGIILHTL